MRGIELVSGPIWSELRFSFIFAVSSIQRCRCGPSERWPGKRCLKKSFVKNCFSVGPDKRSVGEWGLRRGSFPTCWRQSSFHWPAHTICIFFPSLLPSLLRFPLIPLLLYFSLPPLLPLSPSFLPSLIPSLHSLPLFILLLLFLPLLLLFLLSVSLFLSRSHVIQAILKLTI